MNAKRFFIATFVGFIFVAIFEYVVHGIILVPAYDVTPDVWRTARAMEYLLPFSVAMQFFTTAIFCFIYTRHHEGKGIIEGIRFGAMFGVLFGLMQASAYAWLPITKAVAGSWFAANFVEALALGIIFSLIYKK